MTYKNGLYKYGGVVDNSIYHNDVAAKEFVNGLIDPFGVMPTDVLSIAFFPDSDTTTYTMELSSNNSIAATKLKSIYADMGATYRGANIIMTFRVKNEEIVYIRYEIKARGYIQQGYSSYNVGLDINTTTTFTGVN